jgi:excisionase family DNA binding protein
MISFNSSSTIVLNNLISVKVAASYSGYSLQYIRRLLRLEQLIGLKIGQLWLIDKDSFDCYLENASQLEDLRYGTRQKATC